MGRVTTAREFVVKFFTEIGRRPITPEMHAIGRRFAEDVKRGAIQKIINDPISQELKNHTSPSPILGAGTKGTLFGFLGLVEGTTPVDDIIAIVESVMTYTISRRLVKGGFKVTIRLPELKDFRAADLILPWEGGYNVVEAVENGLGGLSHYLMSKNGTSSGHSRSGEGVQSKTQVRNTVFEPRPWLSKIFDEIEIKSKNF